MNYVSKKNYKLLTFNYLAANNLPLTGKNL